MERSQTAPAGVMVFITVQCLVPWPIHNQFASTRGQHTQYFPAHC